MPDDLSVRLQHLLDQTTGVLRQIAPVIGAYYRMLVEEQGIPPEQAIVLVKHLQERYLGSNHAERDT